MEGMQLISCLRFSLQLFLAEAFFVLSWKRKRQFPARLAAGIAGYFLLACLVLFVFTRIPGSIPAVYTVYYISLFGLSLGVMRTAFPATGKEILFAGVCGYAAQHIGFAVSTMIRELGGLRLTGVWDLVLLRILPYLFVDLMVYVVLIRRYEGKSELKERDIRMILLALVLLLVVVYLSVLVDSQMFEGESALLRNVLCKIYAVFCCSLSIFMAFNLSRQNRILRENEMMESMLHSLREQQKLSRENINIINIKCHDLKYRISRISQIEDTKDQQAYDEDVEVEFELETDASTQTAAQGGRQLMITLDDQDVIYAALLDTPAADAFAQQLPITLDMTDYAEREKHAPLDFEIPDADLVNIQYPYEIGDVIYYPPGPTFAMYYDHDGREISAGMEVIARLDEAGIEILGSYGDALRVTVELKDEPSDTDADKSASAAGSSNVLIAYFSVMETDGMDTVAGASRVVVDGEVLGNNEYIARLIQEETGGDVFAIETVQEYPTTHNPLLEFAYEEKSKDARPELASQIADPDSYDVIFLGFPNWNADLPMPLYSFLETYDFAGKTIVPFTTHGGSGFSGTIQTIARLQPDADVAADGLSISRNSVPDAQSEVKDWVAGLGLALE